MGLRNSAFSFSKGLQNIFLAIPQLVLAACLPKGELIALRSVHNLWHLRRSLETLHDQHRCLIASLPHCLIAYAEVFIHSIRN